VLRCSFEDSGIRRWALVNDSIPPARRCAVPGALFAILNVSHNRQAQEKKEQDR
jgi:hypothetical protein